MLIERRVGDVLVTQMGVERTRLTGTARLADDLGLDSLALTEALLVLEDEMTISIPDPVQVCLVTFADLVAVVAAEVHAAGSPRQELG